MQIYEELVKDAAGEFTTSFVHRIDHVKDNRLLPEGWVTAAEFAGRAPDAGIGDQGPLLYELMTATEPEGVEVRADPDFRRAPSTGADRFTYEIPLADLRGSKPASIQATVYSQAFMPAWFHQRFALANEAKAENYDTPATDRLFYLASRLELDGTPMQDWKIEVASTGRLPVH